MKASVGGVEQFAQTVVARGDVGRDERRVGGLILRRHNAKALLAGGVPVAGCQVHKLDMLNAGRGRRVLRQRGDKAVKCLDRSMRLDVHAIARIEHPAANAMRHSLAIHKWPHANTLHNARYMDMHMPHVAPPRQNRPKRTGLFWSVKLLNLPKQTCPFMAGALREIPLQPQALLGGGAGELAVLNAAQAQQAVG